MGNRIDKQWCYSTKTVHLPRHHLSGSVISFACAGEEKLSCELIPKSILLVDFQYKAVLAFCYYNETLDTGNLQNRVGFQLTVRVDSSPRSGEPMGLISDEVSKRQWCEHLLE